MSDTPTPTTDTSLQLHSKTPLRPHSKQLTPGDIEAKEIWLRAFGYKPPSYNPYINLPTQQLVEGIERMIAGKENFKNNPDVQQAFEAYKAVCQKPLAVIEFIDRHTYPHYAEQGFTKKQMELLMAAIIFRASASYGAIARAVADLSDLSMHQEAQILNHNVIEEIGDDKNDPHPILLYNSMETVGNALHCNAPTKIIYQLARHILRLRQLPEFGADFGHDIVKDYGRLVEQLEREEEILPRYSSRFDSTAYRFKTAVEICDLVPPDIIDYHDAVVRATRGLDANGNVPADTPSLKPSNAKRTAINLVEMATREASSVDEFETGHPSYIGTWEQVLYCYLGYVPVDRRKAALEWSHAHSDKNEGKKAGWESSREEGHAKDAREIALKVISHLTPKILAETLREITRLTELRNKLWDDVVERAETKELSAPDPTNPYIPVNPALYQEPKSNRVSFVKKVLGASAVASTLVLGGRYHSSTPVTPPETTTSQAKAFIVPPGIVHALWQQNPAALEDPEQLAFAAHKATLQKTDEGDIVKGQIVCRYTHTDERGHTLTHTIRTGDDFAEDVTELKTLLAYCVVKNPEQGKQL